MDDAPVLPLALWACSDAPTACALPRFGNAAMFSALPEWISPQLAAPPPPARAAHTATRPPVTLNDADKTPVREHAYVCDVCRKTFKRETNLMFHMATHRSRVIDAATGIAVDQKWDAPTSCSCCSRVFATKYQAKKHFLRKHFVGEKMYACDICKVKALSLIHI